MRLSSFNAFATPVAFGARQQHLAPAVRFGDGFGDFRRENTEIKQAEKTPQQLEYEQAEREREADRKRQEALGVKPEKREIGS